MANTDETRPIPIVIDFLGNMARKLKITENEKYTL